MTAAELLACPFCGGKPYVHGPDNPGHEYWISCQSCQASSVMRSNHHAARSAWNARAALTPSEVQTESAKRITGAVLSTLKAGGDNLAIYQAVLGALPAAQARLDPATIEACAKVADTCKIRAQQTYGAAESVGADMAARSIRALAQPSAQSPTPCSHAAIIGLDGCWHCQKCGSAIEMAPAQTSTTSNTPAD